MAGHAGKVGKRLDENQRGIVAHLRTIPGVTVQSLASVGSGCPDILVGSQGKNWVFEIKNLANIPSKRKLTELEQKFFDTWNGQVDIIYTANDALRIMGIIQ